MRPTKAPTGPVREGPDTVATVAKTEAEDAARRRPSCGVPRAARGVEGCTLGFGGAVGLRGSWDKLAATDKDGVHRHRLSRVCGGGNVGLVVNAGQGIRGQVGGRRAPGKEVLGEAAGKKRGGDGRDEGGASSRVACTPSARNFLYSFSSIK